MAQNIYDIGHCWTHERNTDVELIVFVSDKRFSIFLYKADFEGSPALLREYLDKYKLTQPDHWPDETSEFEDPIEEYAHWALQPLLPVFAEVPPLDHGRKFTIQDCLYPESRVYTIRVEERKMVPVRLDDEYDGERYVGTVFWESELAKYSIFPLYRPDEVHIVLGEDSTSLTSHPGKVSIKGEQVCFFKQDALGDQARIMRELDSYIEILSAGFDNDVRVPRLYGVVYNQATRSVLGLLMTYLDCGDVPWLYSRAHKMYNPDPQKWFGQITHTLKALHKHGIVWGDASPLNVLIDKNEDAYLVNFAGTCFQPGQPADTMKGDVEAVEKMRDYYCNPLSRTRCPPA